MKNVKKQFVFTVFLKVGGSNLGYVGAKLAHFEVMLVHLVSRVHLGPSKTLPETEKAPKCLYL